MQSSRPVSSVTLRGTRLWFSTWVVSASRREQTFFSVRSTSCASVCRTCSCWWPVRLGSSGRRSLRPSYVPFRRRAARTLGAVEEADLAATYRRGTVYVMATVHDEMFGMAAIEAQACGLPVICSDQGGLPEVVPLTSGLHVPPGDACALADQMQNLLSDPGLYKELALAARPNALRFSWPVIVSEMFRIYEDVCRQTGAPAAGSRLFPAP